MIRCSHSAGHPAPSMERAKPSARRPTTGRTPRGRQSVFAVAAMVAFTANLTTAPSGHANAAPSAAAVAPTLRLWLDDGTGAGPLVDTALATGRLPDALGCRSGIDPVALAEYDRRFPLTNFRSASVQASSYYYFDGGAATPLHRFMVQAQDPDGIRSIRIRIVTAKMHTGQDGKALRLAQPVTFANVSETQAYAAVLPVYWTGSTGVTHLHDETVLTWNPAAARSPGAPRTLHFDVPTALGLTATMTVEAEDLSGQTTVGSGRFIADAVCYD